MSGDAPMILFGKSALEAWNAASLIEARFLLEREQRWQRGDFSQDQLPWNAASVLLGGRKVEVSPDLPMSIRMSRLQMVEHAWSVSFPVQVLAPSKEKRHCSSYAQSHMFSGALGRKAHVVLCEGVLVPLPEIALAQYAALANDYEVLLAAYELCGLFSADKVSGKLLERPALTTPEAIAVQAARFSGSKGSKKLDFACRYLSARSRSPRETAVALALSLPYRYGGYKLPLAKLNYEVALGQSAKKLCGRDSVECDLCWPDRKVAVFYESDEHHLTRYQLTKDSKRDAALQEEGFFVLRVTNGQLKDLAHTDALAKTLSARLGKAIRPLLADYRQRQLRLRRTLRL